VWIHYRDASKLVTLRFAVRMSGIERRNWFCDLVGCPSVVATDGMVTDGLTRTPRRSSNPSIHAALVQLLGKPIAECRALCVPTAQWGHPMCGPTSVRGFVADQRWQHFSGLGWASLGVLELTALPTIGVAPVL
jgi:hypothetical protein